MAGIGLYIQLLAKQSDEVLTAAYLASERGGNGLFSSADVAGVLGALRVPAPSSIPAHLSNLAKTEAVLKDQTTGKWTLTPLGRERATSVLGEHATASAQAFQIATAADGAEIAEAIHPVIPPAFAPPRWRQGIDRLLERFPFEQNVFCMTRFPDESGNLPDPVNQAVESARSGFEKNWARPSLGI